MHRPPSPCRYSFAGESTRLGLTLLELLVVIAILLAIVGLVVPAVQRVREASARTRCLNHLKQIAVAFHTRHDVRGSFPPGGTICPQPNLSDPIRREAEWTWAYHLLPHLEQEAVHASPDPAVVQATPISFYYCPTRRPPTADRGAAKIDYGGNAGTDPNGTDGVVVRTDKGPIRLTDIPDGTANTVMVGEKRLNRAELGRSRDDASAYPISPWAGDYEVYRTGVEPPAGDETDAGGRSFRTNFGSSHPGAFNVSFCDGSVRTLRYSIDPEAWRRACVRNDNLAMVPYDP